MVETVYLIIINIITSLISLISLSSLENKVVTLHLNLSVQKFTIEILCSSSSYALNSGINFGGCALLQTKSLYIDTNYIIYKQLDVSHLLSIDADALSFDR